MAENSKIEWCHHTFNPWRGCRAISDACANCYAKVLVEGRLQQDFGTRTRAAESTWKQPLAWNRKAAKEGVRHRVFCASLADVFDAEVPDAWRDELFALIAVTPHLDWLLLTKRPKVAQTYITALPERRKEMDCHAGLDWCEWPLPNVWLGTTVESQKMAEARIPHLLATPAAVRFLSMEPLLGEVDLRCIEAGENCFVDVLAGIASVDGRGHSSCTRIDWVIAGGESGPNARPSNPNWFRVIRNQCLVEGVPYLFKQWGEWVAGRASQLPDHDGVASTDRNGTHFLPREPSDFHDFGDGEIVFRVGKKAAGRHLDGVLHDGYPVVG